MRNCDRCGKPIKGKCLNLDGQLIHRACFRCATCDKPITDKYIEQNGKFYHVGCHAELFGPLCAGCGKPILGPYIVAAGQCWHREHFVCAHCGKRLKNGYYEFEGKPYCEQHYAMMQGKRCTVCGAPLIGSYLMNAWGDPFCPEHQGQLPECYSCGRIISELSTGGGVRYADGRHMCSLCRKSAIDTQNACEEATAEVAAVLSRVGFDLTRKLPKLRLVDANEISRLAPKLQSQGQLNGLARTRTWTCGKKVVGVKVDEIVVLHGLPREHFQAVIAHELIHAWLVIQGYPKLEPVTEEGLAEIGAYFWLRLQHTLQARQRLHVMFHNEDPIYGKGFLAARLAMEQLSLPGLLAYVKKHGKLPELGTAH
jgi:hypothetical protein